jgi:hypothetical protein
MMQSWEIMAVITLDMLMQNTQKLYPYTYELATGYRLVSVDTDEQRYLHTWKFLVGEYTCKLQFKVGQKYGDLYSLSKSPVAVSCDCAAYFYWCFPYNRKWKCDCSAPALKKYKKQTNRPPRNITGMPAMCKHLFYLVNELYVDRILKEAIETRLNSIYLAG